MIWYTRNPGMHDISLAADFGKVNQIFDSQVNPLNLDLQRRIINEQVLPIASEDDLLLVVGPQIMFANLVGMWSLEIGKPKYLVWHSQKLRYEIRK